MFSTAVGWLLVVRSPSVVTELVGDCDAELETTLADDAGRLPLPLFVANEIGIPSTTPEIFASGKLGEDGGLWFVGFDCDSTVHVAGLPTTEPI